MKIIPHVEKFEAEYGNAKHIPFTFLHGKLEEDAGYDVFSLSCYEDIFVGAKIISTSFDESSIAQGIYPCTFNDKECTLFLWDVEECGITKKGLVAYNDDLSAFEYAKKCYENKERFI